jgi:hypothetical protein
MSEQTAAQEAMEAAAERVARRRKESLSVVSLDKNRHASYAEPIRQLSRSEIQYFDAIKEGNVENVAKALAMGMDPLLKNDYDRYVDNGMIVMDILDEIMQNFSHD